MLKAALALGGGFHQQKYQTSATISGFPGNKLKSQPANAGAAERGAKRARRSKACLKGDIMDQQ